MSALLAPLRTPEKAGRDQRQLRAVPKPAGPRSNVPFMVLASCVLVFGMGGAIVLNTVIEQQSRELSRLQRQAVSLANQEALLSAQANNLRSPRVLALRATDLGMVVNPNPVYIQLPAGTILGEPVPVTGEELAGMTGDGQ
ncbi:MAG: hypothetical protein Q3997_04495 [Propionibacteriaceae bacterium]|nr:hypothetical protein [Propionibacteriaceae bacterium]